MNRRRTHAISGRDIVLDIAAPRRRRIVRAIVGLTSLATFLGPLHFAAAQATQRPRGLPDDLARRSSERVRPVAVADVAGRMGPDALWRLFDGSASSGLEVWAPTKVRLTFAEPIAVDVIGAFGPAPGVLALRGVDGEATDSPSADLSRGESRWTRLAVKDPQLARTFVVEWSPSRPGAVLPEMEVWGRSSGGGSAARAALPDALYEGLPAGAVAFPASESGTRNIAASTAQSERTLSVTIPNEARSIERAFVVYDLQGLPHFTAVRRAINGGPAIGGFGISRGASGGLQVEEIAPESLRNGVNSVRFEPTDASDPIGYRVSHLRIVTTNSTAGRAQADGNELADGIESTGWENRKDAIHRWTFSSTTQPRELELRLVRGQQGKLVIAGGSGLKRQRVTIDLSALRPGWHKVALDALPPVESLSAVIEGGTEGAIFLSELTITGSPIPDGSGQDLRVTYPLHGECVNHRVHVRALVSRQPVTILANGKVVGDATFEEGAFSFTATEKDLGGSAGKPFSFDVEAQRTGGVTSRAQISIQGCTEKAIASGPANPSRQPIVDEGAPYGAIVSAEKGGSLSFAGAKLQVPPGAVDGNVRLTVRPLDPGQVPRLDAGMTNVTAGGRAFRLGPHGTQFKKALALTLPVDRSRVDPSDHVRTFFFNEAAKKWEELDVLSAQAGQVVAGTTHFTDFIAATMVMPEHPGVQSLNPTSLKDIKLADPASGIGQMAPPVANSEGTANLSYPIEVPPGTHGLEPELAISYDSARGNGWMGMGWDIPISAIEIDTRFGVPKYDGTETYRLDGDELTPLDSGKVPVNAPTGGKYFVRRNEGKFEWIQRLTDGSNTFYWVVTDKAGTTFTYGKSSATRLANNLATTQVFRWCLETVKDMWGNQISYTYSTIAGDMSPGASNGTKDRFQQIYPSKITYGGFSVVFTLKSGTRGDAFSNGRSGFLVLTNQLLDSVEVRNGTTVVRKYQLDYVTGDSGKSLLNGVSLSGLSGAAVLARHTMTYFKMPKGADNNPKYFGDPVQFATLSKAGGGHETSAALSESSVRGNNWGASLGIPFASVGSSKVTVNTNLNRMVEDANGDGLPDLLPRNDTVGNVSKLVLESTDGEPVGQADMSLATFSGWISPFGHELNRHLSSQYNLLIVEGSEDFGNISEADRVLVDFNGDGLPDKVSRGAAADALKVELNKGKLQGFDVPVEYPGYANTGMGFSCNSLLPWGSASTQAAELSATASPPPFPSADIITQWKAPWNGRVRITGAMQRPAGETGGDGMTASLYFGSTLLWQRDIGPADTSSCIPKGVTSGVGGACGADANGFVITVQAGQSIYTRLNQKVDTTHDALNWDLKVAYVDTPTTELASKDATGNYRYQWSEAADQRMMGDHYTPWIAAADGAVNVVINMAKDVTTCDVGVKVAIHSAISGDYTLFYQDYEKDYADSINPVDLGTFGVYAGDEIHVVASSYLPIDPDRIRIAPVITYKSFCRNNPATGDQYCGLPYCVPLDPSIGESAGTQCTLESSLPWTGTSTDPLADQPVAGGLIAQTAPVYFPFERWVNFGGIAPNPPATTVDGRVYATSHDANHQTTVPTTAELCFYNTAPLGNDYISGFPIRPVIQTENKTIAIRSQNIGTPSEPPVCISANLTGTTKGQQVMFGIYLERPLYGPYAIVAKVNGEIQPPGAVDVYVHDSTTPTIDHYPFVGISTPMVGGYHDLYVGTWNANRPFDPSLIVKPSNNDSYVPMQWGPVLSNVPIPSMAMAGLQAAPRLSVSLGDLVTGFGQGLAAGAGVIYDVGKSVLVVGGTTIEKGTRKFGAEAGKAIDFGLCFQSLAGYTVTGIRYSETKDTTSGYVLTGSGVGESHGSTVSGLDLIDMNGDRVLDQVSTAGIRYFGWDAVTSTNKFGPATPTVVIPGKALRTATNKMFTVQVGLGGTFEADRQATDAGGGAAGIMVGGSIAKKVSQGLMKTSRDLRDINGDGLPDLITTTGTGDSLYQLTVQLNYGYKFGNPITWASRPWAKRNVKPLNAYSATGQGPTTLLNKLTDAYATNDPESAGTIRLDETGHKGGSVGLNVTSGDGSGGGVGRGVDETYTRTIVDLVDVNGDGLPDQVMKQPGPGQSFLVKLNKGMSFDTEIPSEATSWDWAGPLPALLITDGGEVTPATVDTLAFSRSDAWSENGNLSYMGLGGDLGRDGSGQKLIISFMDIDGDGRLDHVLKNADLPGASPGNEKVWVRPNQVGKSNLLATVSLPLGGSISLDYTPTGNMVSSFSTGLGSLNVDSPDSKWALTKVTVDDGISGETTQNPSVDRIDYRMAATGQTDGVTSGFYDRGEREFLGFARVTTTHGDGTFKRLYFLNQAYHAQHRLLAEFDFGSDLKALRGSINSYILTATPSVTVGRTTRSSQYVSRVDTYDVVYDGRVTDSALDAIDFRNVNLGQAVPTNGSIIHYSYRTFDANGDPAAYVDSGDLANTSDDVNFTIHNATFSGTHFTAPDSITATPSNDSATTLQKRTATFGTVGGHPALTQLSDLVFRGNQPGTTTAYSGQASTYAFTYNTADMGNLAAMTDPTGYKLTYAYDATHTYVASVTDSFGYVSSATWDPNFGLPLTTTDENGKVVTYNYDSYGRTTKVWGPTDPTTGTATIQMSYSQAAGGTPPAHPWAMTKHKDVSGTIDTVTFVDGLGRLIETKKEAEVMVSGTKTSGFAVSGKIVYDVRGRVMSQAQPSFDTGTTATNWVSPSTSNATSYTYDALGRSTDVMLADANHTATAYSTVMPGATTPTDDPLAGAAGTLELTKVTDPRGKAHRSYRDGASRIVAVKEKKTFGSGSSATVKALVTKYTYDGLGNVATVVDALNNTTSAVYDSLSRLVKLTSLDAGQTEYRFGLNGLLMEKQTPNLRGANKLIKYTYDVNRLTTITYPTLGVVSYAYGPPTDAGDAKGNRAGRLKTVTMEGGSEIRAYDAFGNVSQTTTTLTHINNTTLAAPSVVMKYTYDWLGRMQSMTFPKTVDLSWKVPAGDGEIVNYAYDKGGLLKKISSSTDTYVADIGYDAFGQRVMLKSGNNITNNYGYDAKRRFLKTVTATAAPSSGSVQFHALTYGYDANGNITTIDNAPPAAAIRPDGSGVGAGPLSVVNHYDELNQLIDSTARYRGFSTLGWRYATTFDYDEIGNLKTKAQTDVRLKFKSTDTTLSAGVDGPTVASTTYTMASTYPAGHPHQARTIAETPSTGSASNHTVGFDLDGNKTTDAFNGKTRTLTWDEEDRLKQVQDGSVVVSRFLYTPEGERTQRQDISGNTTFYFNQFLVLHGDAAHNVTKHIYAGETRVASKMESIQNTTPTRMYYHPDNLGSTSYITDASQNLLEHDRYFPFGESWSEFGYVEKTGAGHRDWMFTGKELDADTGLYYFGARYYEPRTTTWQSTDPILASYMRGTPNGGGANPANLGLYSYAWSNPFVLRDPTGRCVETGSSGPCDEAVIARMEETRAVSGSAVVETAAGFVPLVGDALDLKTLVDPDSSGLERLIAGGSLIIGAGPLPNLGPGLRAGRRATHEAIGAGEQVAKSAVKGGEAAANRAKNVAKGIPESRLGPSGEPKILVKQHATRKRAEDATQARSQRGRAPEEHSNPTEGEAPHFHPSGSRSREHHAYPPKKGFPRNERY